MKIDLRSTGYKVIGALPFLYNMKLQLLYNIYPACMKIVFTIYLFIISTQVFPRTLITGSGRGAIIQNDMNGLKPGDTLAIRSGLYEKGGSLSNLTGITIINYQGIVDFGKTVSLGNLKMVTISGAGWKLETYGIRFRNFRGDAFILHAACSSLNISYCEYRNLDGTAFDASRFFTAYTGDSSTFALYKTTFNYQKLVHSGPLFTGSWAANAAFQNVVDSIAFLHIIVDSTSSDVCQVLGHSIYHMLASHWRVTGPCPNGKHDAGIFQTSGNGTICNVYRKDGWGYLWRVWNLGLNGRADSYLYNCIDLNTNNYGTIDTRIEAGDTTTGNNIPFIKGANMHVLNNTIGNKRSINYVSQLVIAGTFCSENGYLLEVRNNLCFNTVSTGADPIIKQNTSDKLMDTSNNLYVKDPIAAGILIDTIECKLNPSGPAIDHGINFSFIPTDIDGIRRPIGKSSDIGAREFPDVAVSPGPDHGAGPEKWLFFVLTTFLAVIFALVYRNRNREKPEKSRLPFQGQPLNTG
ncbi:MAG TPA: choice-of-anchor Q domain-containing protein [Puia sp.]|nr:choice-of-anchor Q domain-containing protein [Puia sp.]